MWNDIYPLFGRMNMAHARTRHLVWCYLANMISLIITCELYWEICNTVAYTYGYEYKHICSRHTNMALLLCIFSDFLFHIFDCRYFFSEFYIYFIFCLCRCKSFQSTKRGELCRIPGSSVLPTSSGAPVQIRLPSHVNADVFRQFLLYIYTGKVCECDK